MSKIKKILAAILIIIFVILVAQVINAEKYKMTVNVLESEDEVRVNPTTEKLDFGDISRNNGMSRYVTLKSEGKTSAHIMVWKFGEISDLVKISKNRFVIEPGQEERLSFTINVPPSAEIKQYTGRVWIFRLPKLF